MATRKSSSKAKTKTTKTTSKSSGSKTRKVLMTPVQRIFALNYLHIASLVLFVGLAVLAVVLMQSVTLPLSITHLTSDALLSGQSTAFSTAHRNVYDMDLRWSLVGILALSSVLPVLYLTRLKDYYASVVKKGRVNSLRWIDLAVTSGLMVEVILLLVGYNDLMMLKLAGALIGVTCVLGWMAEQQNESAKKPVWSAFALSLFTGLAVWTAVGVSKFATIFYGEIRSPWYVYALCITTLAGFSLLAINQYNSHRRFRNWADYAIVERNYVLISMATKIAFAGILISGLMK